MAEAQHTLVVERHLEAPIAKVFDAFADVAKFAQWFGPSPRVPLEIFDYEFEPGGRYRICFHGESGSKDIVGGTYVSITAPTQIVFTWQWEAPHTYEGLQTLVTVDLTEKDGTTHLVLTHEKLPSTEAKANHDMGWSGALDQLGPWLARTHAA